MLSAFLNSNIVTLEHHPGNQLLITNTKERSYEYVYDTNISFIGMRPLQSSSNYTIALA